MTGSINIVVRAQKYIVDGTPFKGDLFDRENLSKKLTAYINRVQGGCVIAINAPWGDGKTWFGRNWELALTQDEYTTIYLDAFASDYAVDPFWLITSAISKKISGTKKKKFRDATINVLKSAVPFTAKFAVSVVSNKLLGDSDISDIINEAGTGDAAEKYLSKQLEEHDKHAESVENFKVTLSDYTSSLKKPLIVFIDELDRCTPDFSVRLLERIKHFFEVDKVIFILLINREQLEEAIKGVYGENINASAYLSKFLSVTFNIPKLIASTNNTIDYNERYCRELAGRHNIPDGEDIQGFIAILCRFAASFEISFRDLERAFSLFAIAYPIRNNQYRSGVLTYLIILKLKRHDLFLRLANGEIKAHQEANTFLATIIPGSDSFFSDILLTLRCIHDGYSNTFNPQNDRIRNILGVLQIGLRNPYQIIPNLIDRIDVSIG